MKKINPLIRKQNIRICDHKREEEHVWCEEVDIHLHKTTNYDKKKYDIKVSLNHDYKKPCENDGLPRKLKKEIREAFSAPEKKRIFINQVLDSLKGDFSWNENSDKGKGEKERIVKNIEMAFGLEICEKPFDPIRESDNQVALYAKRFADNKSFSMFRNGDFETFYHIVLKSHERQIFVGETPLTSVSVHKEAKIRWVNTVLAKLPDLIEQSEKNCEDSIERLSEQTSGIGKIVVKKTCEYIAFLKLNSDDFEKYKKRHSEED